jgi:hypothetical protein
MAADRLDKISLAMLEALIFLKDKGFESEPAFTNLLAASQSFSDLSVRVHREIRLSQMTQPKS